MWSLEDHCRERGRVIEKKSAKLREFSNSPPRTPEDPLYSRQGVIVRGTCGFHDCNSWSSLPTTDKNATTAILQHTNSSSVDSNLATSNVQGEESSGSSPLDVESDLELWEDFQKSNQDSDDSDLSVVGYASPAQDTVRTDAQMPTEINVPREAPTTSYCSVDIPFAFDTTSRSALTLRDTNSKRLSLSRADGASRRAKISPTSCPHKSMYSNARTCSVQHLQNLLDSPKVDIINQETSRVYLKAVSLDMLNYFCGGNTVASLLHQDRILVPPAYASEDGIIRVIRYMRRWCLNASVRPTGELRTPPSIKEGIATSLACRFFGLDVDAQHMEDLVVQHFMCSPRSSITDEDVELIWCGYEGSLTETPFGDAIIWFILAYVMSDTHALAHEVRWMLEQEDYEDLKARIRIESKRAAWRKLGRSGFLQWCSEDRAQRRAAGRIESVECARQGSSVDEKPLPHIPAGS